MGRGPKDVQAHLIDDLVVVRLKGVLTSAEQHLVKTLSSDKGRDLGRNPGPHLWYEESIYMFGRSHDSNQHCMVRSLVDAGRDAGDSRCWHSTRKSSKN